MSTPKTIIDQLNADITLANSTTGQQDITVHNAILSLINGYSQGDSSFLGSGEVVCDSDIFVQTEIPNNTNLLIMLANNIDNTKTYGVIAYNIKILKNIITTATDYCTSAIRLYGTSSPSPYIPSEYLGIKYDAMLDKTYGMAMRTSTAYNMQRGVYRWYAYNIPAFGDSNNNL